MGAEDKGAGMGPRDPRPRLVLGQPVSQPAGHHPTVVKAVSYPLVGELRDKTRAYIAAFHPKPSI